MFTKILIVLILSFSQAVAEQMTSDDYYKIFIQSESFSDAKKDVLFFVSHFYEKGEIYIHDYKVILNCLEDYPKENLESISPDKCYKGEVFFKVEYRAEPNDGTCDHYDVGYVSGVIDFEDPEVSKKILFLSASFFGPEGNKPIKVQND